LDVLLSDDHNHAGEQTLENVEDIANWSVVAESGECRTVKYHFPLDSSLGREEGGGVYWNLDAHGRGPGQTVGGLEWTRAFDAEEHTRVDGGNIAPTVLVDEVGLEPQEPPVGTGVGGAKSICASEGDAGPGRPVVHSLHAARETDYRGRGIGHCGEGRRIEGEGEGMREKRRG